MDSIARLDADERRLYFEQAAARHGRLSAQLIEKDFWVCWTLRRIFELPFAEYLTFKGGTSLSKVFNVIERFSEDIDLTIDRESLGFGGDDDPEKSSTTNETERRIAKLVEACKHFVSDELYPNLNSVFGEALGDTYEWAATLNDDSDTIEFQFPPAITSDLSKYFAPSIKIEFGARADSYPVEAGTIAPYLHEAFPDIMKDSEVTLKVLDAERTFWEKATILHSIHHRPAKKAIVPRQSRHYYDLFQLASCDIGVRAMQRLDLLTRVAEHKRIYFRAGWAKYTEAKPGTLRLVPTESRRQEVQRDYKDMQPMFFGDAPSFNKIMGRLVELEEELNT